MIQYRFVLLTSLGEFYSEPLEYDTMGLLMSEMQAFIQGGLGRYLNRVEQFDITLQAWVTV